ncbi:MAG: hypothetical protein K2K63_10330 [Acetatifactor sp.]|nr:hypothetical protein [Acetatifactor sp.]
MTNYEKPVVLANEDIAEGVYAASGATIAVSGGSVTGTLISCDHYGNYYMKMAGFENGATYRIVLTVSETAAVSGLKDASWGGFGGVVNGNTVTFENVCFGNQTDWHVRLWFDSQGDWENGWQLQDADIPGLSVSVTKVG